MNFKGFDELILRAVALWIVKFPYWLEVGPIQLCAWREKTHLIDSRLEGWVSKLTGTGPETTCLWQGAVLHRCGKDLGKGRTSKKGLPWFCCEDMKRAQKQNLSERSTQSPSPTPCRSWSREPFAGEGWKSINHHKEWLHKVYLLGKKWAYWELLPHSPPLPPVLPFPPDLTSRMLTFRLPWLLCVLNPSPLGLLL